MIDSTTPLSSKLDGIFNTEWDFIYRSSNYRMLTENTGFDKYLLLNTDQDRNNSHGDDKSFLQSTFPEFWKCFGLRDRHLSKWLYTSTRFHFWVTHCHVLDSYLTVYSLMNRSQNFSIYNFLFDTHPRPKSLEISLLHYFAGTKSFQNCTKSTDLTLPDSDNWKAISALVCSLAST